MIEKTLGHYRVGEQLGRGGMGEVYLADDLNLNRKVALKFLPDAFAGDPERMARFEREAKVLASLNHPNIASIHGLEQAEGERFIVMELVEGETLAQRLSKGSLPVDEALGICRQIAEGLEAAHEKGVIHRDLKPANVMITEGDKVKILDFGLAKALSGETQPVEASQSPTLTEAMTRPGIILGTAAYMSPEQAKGKAVDKRADIWAFGCILYECLTGKRAFEGETATEILAAILKGEPDWNVLPATTLPSIRFVLRRCLHKNMSGRFHCVGDLRLLIEEEPTIVEPVAPVNRSWLAWSIAAVLLAALLLLGFTHLRPKEVIVAEPMRLQITPPATLAPEGSFALSPDGRHLAFAALGSDGVARLWVRALNSFETRPLVGTESSYVRPFFWSPDSRFIAFESGGKLRKIEISGGPPRTICDLSGILVGGSWNSDGVIILGNSSGGLQRVSAAGGAKSPLTEPNRSRQDTNHTYPTYLPDGRHFLYLCTSGKPEDSGVYAGSLDIKPEEQGSKKLLATNFGVVYVPSKESGPGWLFYVREQTLMAQRFDEKELELSGDPLPLAEQVGSFMAFGFFSASKNGVLVYRRGGAGTYSRTTWFDRQGKLLGIAAEDNLALGVRLSPDGSRAASSFINTSQSSQTVDLWLLDFARGTKTRFTYGDGQNVHPIWSPDGSRIIFASSRENGVYNLYRKLASGAKEEELLLRSPEYKLPTSWSRDGRFLLYTASDPKTKADLWVLPLEGNSKETPFLRTPFDEFDGSFSPDMRWVAYVSDESGNNEVYVRGFSQKSGGEPAGSSGGILVSKGGGTGPRWRGDGKELYYRAPDGKMTAVEVAADSVFRPGTPKPLFQAPPSPSMVFSTYISFPWDVTAGGDRFILGTTVAEGPPSPFNVILNWTALLKK